MDKNGVSENDRTKTAERANRAVRELTDYVDNIGVLGARNSY